MHPIYLDYNATTPLDPAVVDAMVPYLREHFGNPSSAHAYGKTAHDAVETARKQVADLINAQPDEIVFTGGGSEASNLAIKGVAFASWRSDPTDRPHIITSVIEHPATLQPCEFLERLGVEITRVPVDGLGRIDPECISRNRRRNTVLATIMHANNETGTIQPIRETAKLARAAGVLMHTDAAQSLGKVRIDVEELEVDLLSIAGHKLYAPKGVGVLYVRRGLKLEPLVHGAGHESGRRAGTENVPYIVGLGKACELCANNLDAATAKLKRLRDRLWELLKAGLGERISLNGHPEERLPNTLNANFVGHIGAELLTKVPGVAASTGSACHEGQVKLSPVLAAMGVPKELGQGALRLTVGRFTTEEEIESAARLLISACGLAAKPLKP